MAGRLINNVLIRCFGRIKLGLPHLTLEQTLDCRFNKFLFGGKMVGLTTPGDFSTSSSIGYSKARITIFKKEVDGGLKEFTRRFTAALFLRASPFSGATLFCTWKHCLQTCYLGGMTEPENQRNKFRIRQYPVMLNGLLLKGKEV